MTDCEICGGEDHFANEHEIIASADWSRGYGLHLKDNMIDFAFRECQALGVDVNQIIADRDQFYRARVPVGGEIAYDTDIEFEVECFNKIEAKLAEAGYIPVSDADLGEWIIYKDV